MNRLLSIVALLSVVACGTQPGGEGSIHTSDVVIRNSYAESNFSLSYTVADADGGVQEVVIATDEPILSGRSERFEKAIAAEVGTPITIHLSAMSLGERRTFPAHETTVGTRTLEIEYDYNLATSNFRASYSWP